MNYNIQYGSCVYELFFTQIEEIELTKLIIYLKISANYPWHNFNPSEHISSGIIGAIYSNAEHAYFYVINPVAVKLYHYLNCMYLYLKSQSRVLRSVSYHVFIQWHM